MGDFAVPSNLSWNQVAWRVINKKCLPENKWQNHVALEAERDKVADMLKAANGSAETPNAAVDESKLSKADQKKYAGEQLVHVPSNICIEAFKDVAAEKAEEKCMEEHAPLEYYPKLVIKNKKKFTVKSIVLPAPKGVVFSKKKTIVELEGQSKYLKMSVKVKNNELHIKLKINNKKVKAGERKLRIIARGENLDELQIITTTVKIMPEQGKPQATPMKSKKEL